MIPAKEISGATDGDSAGLRKGSGKCLGGGGGGSMYWGEFFFLALRECIKETSLLHI